MKTCSTCELTKPLSEFYKSPTCKGGYNSQCKDCRKEYRKEYLLRKQKPEPKIILRKKIQNGL